MSKTVLLVDDSATLRMSVEMALDPAGYQVVHARDGEEGLKVLEAMKQKNRPPGLIISDINMPNMDGITFIREVKKGPYKYLPIVVLTTERGESKKLSGKKAGAAGWMVKPFKPETLVAVVKKFTRSLA